jgi:predicted secreted Zn-dependent protease
MMHSFATASLLAALTLAAPADLRRFEDYPDTQIEYYTVSGTTAQEIREQIRRRGPNNGGTSDAAARAWYTYDWSATSAGPKSCKATVKISTRIRFPRHANPASLTPAMRAEWMRFTRDLEHHEVGHVALAYRWLPKFKAALENGPCSGAERRAGKVDAELQRKQEAFDASPANKVPGMREVG